MGAPDAPLPAIADGFDDAPCGLLLTRGDGTIVRANRTLCRWIGHDGDELVGRLRVQDLLTMGGRIFHQTHWQPLLALQRSVAEVKIEMTHRDGHRVPMLLNAVRREHAGAVFDEFALIVVADRDLYERELVRARRHAEELLAEQQAAQQALAVTQAKLRLALDSARLAVWELDVPSGALRFDDSAALMLGYPSPRPIDAAAYAAAIDPADRAHEAAAFAQAMDPAVRRYRCEYRLNGVDGVQRVVSSIGSAGVESPGPRRRFVGVLQDISEQSRQRAAAEDRALLAEQMIGIVSHDLRNPLSAIEMGTVLLGRGELTPNQRRVLDRVANSTRRAHRLTADLLDFTLARLGRGLAVACRPIDLHALVAESVDELRLAFPGRSIEHAANGSGTCEVDADRVMQLLGNLVANAVAYGAPDRPVRVVSAVDEASCVVSVHNDGAPVPAELLPTIFEPMIRGDASGDARRSVGLGLFIVREIARAHRGDVRLASTATDGTTFTATLPRHAPAAPR